MTNSGSTVEYYPILDQATVWNYVNNQPGHDSFSGEVTLYLTCEKTYAPSVTPTAPTAEPTLEKEPCAKLSVTTEEDAIEFRYNGIYEIVNNISHYEFRDGKNQWYKNGNRSEGHLFYMNNESPMWQHVWLINSPAGYLGIKDTVYNSIRPEESERWDVYTNGEI